ncbi:MAG: TetR family transcriptional regulator [Phyllobacteriaceae bacterium]|nr:TetR family transcriptional regulator [Phyllobacteriaceae bacterium]MBA90065.1 TetR family transcriptional regulator [Phyllobacteriaceae bacterium]
MMDPGPDLPLRQSYHHGDLRSALLAAAEQELAEKGIENFSMRGVAKRAGVSHAAPAHHFRDVNGLLTALSAQGFRRLVERQHVFMKDTKPDAWNQLMASGLGYVVFALENPPVFRLMFSSGRPDLDDPELKEAVDASYAVMVDLLRILHGAGPDESPAVGIDMAAAWAVVHGLADILASNRLPQISGLPPQARNMAIMAIIGRAMPDLTRR